MPNIASSQSKSMTTLTGDVSFHDNAIEILNAIGSTLWLNSEKELDIATALAGCAPAYLAMVAEALCDGAVKEGLTRTDAQKLTTGLFDGFASLLHVQHPALLKESVMSPAGMTAVGVAILEKYAMRFAFMEAIAQSYEKSQKVQK